MDTLVNLCRCCLSPHSEVSILDHESNVKEKFLEVTSIEVDGDDGLPHKLCSECFSSLNSAYKFRKLCIKMDRELKLQQETAIQKSEEANVTFEKLINRSNSNGSTDEIPNVTMKQLQEIIKEEPVDSDDDCYYVLVIDNPKDKKPDKKPLLQVKEEIVQDSFENSIDSFLVTGPKVPANVPATILQNEEEEDDSHLDQAMNIDEDNSQDSPEETKYIYEATESQDRTSEDVETITTSIDGLPEGKNYIKILTTSGTDGKLVLKGTDNVAYLTETSFEDGEGMSQEEVIVYEEDDSNQYQIVKCEGELVIEYADEIATVLQQEDGTFLCDCGEQFEDLSEYEKHQYSHHATEDHLCNLCGKGFESSEILTGHMLLHKVSGLFIMCPFCNQLVKRNTLTQHIKYGHNNIKPRCNLCLKTFANPNNLKRHMMIHSGIRQFECDMCFKRFHQKITMQTHRLTHIEPFPCNQCDESFKNRVELDNHKESNDCTRSKLINIRNELLKNVKQEITTHQGKLLGYACSLCKKMFSLESALVEHVESNHMDLPMELLCADCGQVLPSRKEMQSHILMHKNAKCKNMKRFECGTCGKGCSSQAMLIMHERVHTNERPFPCQLCALKFKTKTHLRTHQLTHTREKKFGCSVCMKFFALKGNLVVHLRTHTGERPYACNMCDEAFIDSKYLKKHKQKKHQIDNVTWNKF